MIKPTPREAIESAINTLKVVQNDHNIGCSGAISDLESVVHWLPYGDEFNTFEKLRELKGETERIEELIADRVEEALANPEQEPVAFIDINKLELKAEEAECIAMCLNDRGVPTHEGSKDLSLWGRVEQYAKPRFLEGMTTNTPSVSDEHIKDCAKVAGLIGNWSTTEVNDRIVGFARVLLGNPAVQEAFVKANTHLLYTTTPQPKEPEQERVIECDCITSIAPNGLRQTKCGSDQMRRAVQEGAAFSKQPEQEPVAEMYETENINGRLRVKFRFLKNSELFSAGTKFYTTQPQRKLTDEQIDQIESLMTDLAEAVFYRDVDKVPAIRKQIIKAANGIKE